MLPALLFVDRDDSRAVLDHGITGGRSALQLLRQDVYAHAAHVRCQLQCDTDVDIDVLHYDCDVINDINDLDVYEAAGADYDRALG